MIANVVEDRCGSPGFFMTRFFRTKVTEALTVSPIVL